jgi:iron complex transport system substrate-binding protein
MRSIAALVPLGVAGLLLAGCATAAPQPAATGGGSADAAVTVDNCGTEVTFDAAPERVVTIKSSTTEMLLALGVGDRIVATAYPDGPVPDEWASEAPELPVLAERVPSQEVVLEQEPDLVYAGWESNFSPDGAGERESLAALGVHTYVAPSACKGEGYRPNPLTADDVFAEIREVADVFRVPDAAEELIAEQTEQLDGIEPLSTEASALWFSSGTDTPFVGAGIGAPQLILDRLGLANIAGDIEDSWAPFNWEAVVDADPDVIVLVDADWNSVEQKIEVLESNPATSNLTAVREERYLTVDFAATEAGVRTVPAIAELADQLAALGLD